MLAPFIGLFANPQVGPGVIEFNSLVAMIFYALIAWAIGKLAWLIAGETRSAVKVVVSGAETRVVR